MKMLMLAGLSVITLLTVAQPIWAQGTEAGSLSASMEGTREPRLSDLGMHLNPQIGVSSFAYSGDDGGSSSSKLSGGLTVEFGAEMRKMETGILLVSTQDSSLLTIPMLAKLRVFSMRAQSWYAKFGFMPAFEVSSSRDAETNNLDVLASVGAGGRLAFNKNMDLIIEGSYNRGLLDAVRTQSSGSNHNQGVLVMAGLSFGI